MHISMLLKAAEGDKSLAYSFISITVFLYLTRASLHPLLFTDQLIPGWWYMSELISQLIMKQLLSKALKVTLADLYIIAIELQLKTLMAGNERKSISVQAKTRPFCTGNSMVCIQDNNQEKLNKFYWLLSSCLTFLSICCGKKQQKTANWLTRIDQIDL